MTPNERHLTERPPDGRRTLCPLPAMRNRLWPGGIRGAPRLRKGSQARRRPAKRQRPAPTVKRVAGCSPKTCRKDDPAPIGIAASGASGAIPDTADARPSASTSSGATPVASPVTGRPETPASGGPEIPASGRPSGNRDANDAPAAADSPGPWTPATPPTTGGAPAMPNKKEKRSEGSCASRTTASATELSMS